MGYSDYSISELERMKRDAETKKSKCSELQSVIGSFQTGLTQSKDDFMHDKGNNYYVQDLFNNELTIEKFQETNENFINSELTFRDAYSSGEYSFTFFDDIAAQYEELVTARQDAINELERILAVIDDYESTCSSFSSLVSNKITELDNQISSIQSAINSKKNEKSD